MKFFHQLGQKIDVCNRKVGKTISNLNTYYESTTCKNKSVENVMLYQGVIQFYIRDFNMTI